MSSATSGPPTSNPVDQHLRLSLAAAGVATWEFDMAARLVRFDACAAALLRIPSSASPCTAHEWLRSVAVDDRDRVTALLQSETSTFRVVVQLRTDEQTIEHLVVLGARSGAVMAGVIADHTQQEALLEARRRSAADYQMLFDSIPLPAIVYDPESMEIVRWNVAAKRQSTRPPDEAGPKSLHDVIPPDEMARVRAYLAAVEPGKTTISMWRVPGPDGAMMDLEITAHDVHLDGRRLRVGIGKDVTAKHEQERALLAANQGLEAAVRERTADLERTIDALRAEVLQRRRVEAELRDHQEHLLLKRHVLASSQRIARVGHWDHDAASGRQTWSVGAFHLLGYAEDEVEPTFDSFIARVHPDDRARLESQRYRQEQHEPTWVDEYRVVHASGAVRCIRELGEATFDDHGRLVRLLGIVQDVTDIHDLRRSVESRNAFLRALIDEIPAHIGVRDGTGRLTMVNRSFADFYGESVEAIQRDGRCNSWSPEEEAAILAGDSEVFATGQVVVTLDERAVDRQGRVRFMTRTKRIIGSPKGDERLLLCIAIDHTDRRQYELRRQEMEKLAATGRMAARVAHEINNPLAGIKSAFRLLSDEIPTWSENHHYVGRIEREINRIAAIVRQMFDLYRPPSDVSSQADLGLLIDDVAHLVKSQLRERNLHLTVEGLERRCVLTVDDAVLRPVFFNLIQNAIEASPDGGSVRVRVASDPDRTSLLIEDEGAGIDESIRSRVFEPFFTTKSGIETGGLGLGLSIARSAIESIGGLLDFHSPRGGGTTFRIVLPFGSNP